MLELRLLYDYAIGVPQQCHETKRVTASQQRLLTLVVSNSCDVELTQRLPTMPLDTNVQCTLIIEPQRKVTEEQSDMSPSLQAVVQTGFTISNLCMRVMQVFCVQSSGSPYPLLCRHYDILSLVLGRRSSNRIGAVVWRPCS